MVGEHDAICIELSSKFNIYPLPIHCCSIWPSMLRLISVVLLAHLAILLYDLLRILGAMASTRSLEASIGYPETMAETGLTHSLLLLRLVGLHLVFWLLLNS